MRTLRIGSRGSPLALWQANHVAAWLRARGAGSEIIRIRTTGDQFQHSNFDAMGLKGVFIKELEDALLTGHTDLAVHSMKDVPTAVPPGLVFPAIPPREDVRDCVISRDGLTLEKLPAGARVGTSSLRRQAQIRRARPDLVPVDIRGNVDTRIRKLDHGEFEAIILARAGIERLGLTSRIAETLDPSVMLSAVGQGALGVEARAGDPELLELLSALDDPDTRAAVTAERALLAELEGGCQVPLGAWGRIESTRAASANRQLLLDACVCSSDGKDLIRDTLRGPAEDPEALGRQLAHRLLDAGADRILRHLGRTVGGR
ncbi:MAG: hydroxymethylbilane synthase [Acidipila sp.]|nr:hydroxymethylbilane synthase [Acidipila sp.]